MKKQFCLQGLSVIILQSARNSGQFLVTQLIKLAVLNASTIEFYQDLKTWVGGNGWIISKE
jgi:hypothetical protein